MAVITINLLIVVVVIYKRIMYCMLTNKQQRKDNIYRLRIFPVLTGNIHLDDKNIKYQTQIQTKECRPYKGTSLPQHH